MKLGIVGCAADKFTPVTEALARKAICGAIVLYKATHVVSGKCKMGGIDIWSIEEAIKLGCIPIEFPPAVDRWEGTKDQPGFHQRNIQIAEASDVVMSIVVKVHPPGYAAKKWTYCYHCKTSDHIKSGGCYTAKYARSLGKQGFTVVIDEKFT